MRLSGALALVAATALAGCTSAPVASSSPSARPSLSPAASPIPSALPTALASPAPTDQPFAPAVSCTHPYNSTHGVALVSYPGAIGVLDVSNGLKPFLLCWFSPAQGAAFDRAANQVVFWADRKSTRLNSSHVEISYAVFCLKKKTDIARHVILRARHDYVLYGDTTV